MPIVSRKRERVFIVDFDVKVVVLAVVRTMVMKLTLIRNELIGRCVTLKVGKRANVSTGVNTIK